MKKILLPLLGLIVSLVGVYIGWKQYQRAKEAESKAQPNVVVCLSSFDYQRSNTRQSGTNSVSDLVGQVSFRLINKGGTEVTVTRVMLVPLGVMHNGQRMEGSEAFFVRIDRDVPAKGVISIDNLAYVGNLGVPERYWIDKLEKVDVQAFWPSGNGPMLQCMPAKSGWSCGRGYSEGFVVADDACQ